MDAQCLLMVGYTNVMTFFPFFTVVSYSCAILEVGGLRQGTRNMWPYREMFTEEIQAKKGVPPL